MLQCVMEFVPQLRIFAVTSLITLVIDFIWLGFIANKLYLSELGSLVRKSASGSLSPLWVPAILVYLVIPLAITLFAVPKGIQKSTIEAFMWGALLGMSLYAVYDLTNLATLQNWS